MIRPAHNATALALVLAFLLTQFAGVLHLATERHEVCADHGELVHGAELHAHSSDEEAHEGPALDRLEGDREHAHCDQLPVAEHKQRATLPAPARLPAPSVHPARYTLAARAAHPPIPLLSLAPKLSPPA